MTVSTQDNGHDNTQDMNKLIDCLINYAKEYHIKRLDPFYMREKHTIDFNEYATVVINQCIIFGAANIRRVANKRVECKALGDRRWSLSADLQVQDLRVNVNFDAKLGWPHYRFHPRLKTCCVSVGAFVFTVEWVLSVRHRSIKAERVALVAKDRIRCVSTGFMWPLNKTVETLIRKNVELFIDDNQPELEFRAKQAINQWLAPTFEELFDDNSLVADKEFKTVIQRLK